MIVLVALIELSVARARLRDDRTLVHCALGAATRRAPGCLITPPDCVQNRALVHAALGDTGEARRVAGEQLELARAFGRPRTVGNSLRACGLVEGGETSLELLREAVQRLERSQSPLELARARSDYGAAL